MPFELIAVAIAVFQRFAQILAVAVPRGLLFGYEWAASVRDDTPELRDIRIQRANRALQNYRETFPIFIALALAVVVADVTSGVPALGAALYVGGRIVYPFFYVFHVPFMRSIVWTIAKAGLVLLVLPLLSASVS